MRSSRTCTALHHVREAFLFSARLHLTEDITTAQVLQIVDDALEMVDMTGIKDSIVVDAGAWGCLHNCAPTHYMQGNVFG